VTPRKRASWTGALVALLLLQVHAAGSALHAQSAPAADSDGGALVDFGALVVGRWETEDSRHDFAWGVGERVLRSTSYAADGDHWVIVSEGWWYWDPGEGTIRGQTVAVGMGIDLFEYRSRVSGSEVVHDLVSHGEFGGVFVERWTFDEAGYSWTLEQDGERIMGGAFRRIR
jgi:hypothetical protein